MTECIICGTEFTPTNKGHRKCSNRCCVSLYEARFKVRTKIKDVLKSLHTPEQVKEFHLALDQIFGDENRAN